MVIKQDPDQPDCHQGEEDQEEEEEKELLEDQRSQNEVGNIATPRAITNFFYYFMDIPWQACSMQKAQSIFLLSFGISETNLL